MCSGYEEGSHLRLIDSCITQFEAQGPSRTCHESKEEEGAPAGSSSGAPASSSAAHPTRGCIPRGGWEEGGGSPSSAARGDPCELGLKI